MKTLLLTLIVNSIIFANNGIYSSNIYNFRKVPSHQDNTYKSYYFVFSKRKLVFIKKRIKIILFSTIKSIYLKVLIY